MDRIKEQLDHVWKDAEVYQTLLQSAKHQDVEQIKRWCLRTSEYLLSLGRNLKIESGLKSKVNEVIRVISDISARLAQIRARSFSPMSQGDDIPTRFYPLRKSPGPDKRDMQVSTVGQSPFQLLKSLSAAQLSADQQLPQLRNEAKPQYFTEIKHQQSQLQSRLLSPGKVHERIRQEFNDPQRPVSTLYKSERETLEDMQRLIVFEDFEGIKARTLAMQRERIKCETLIDAQIQEIKELREQILTRDILVSQTEQLNQCNQREYSDKINETLHKASELRSQLEKQIVDLQCECQSRMCQIESLRKDLDQESLKHSDAVIFADDQRRQLLQARADLQALEDQNRRVAKEFLAYQSHQEVLVQSMEQKQMDTKRHYTDKCERLRQVISQKDEDFAHQSGLMTQLEHRISQLQQDARNLMERQQHDHGLIQSLEHTSERKTREHEEVYSQLTRQTTQTEVHKAHAYRLDIELQNASKEINTLQAQSDQQNTLISRLEETLLQQEAKTKELQDRYDSDIFRSQKELHEAHMQFSDAVHTKNKEIDIVSRREDTARENLCKLQQDYQELERQYRGLKQQEFDKVNVMCANSELSGRISSQKLEIEELSKERGNLQHQLSQKANECRSLELQIQQLQHENEALKRQHEEHVEGCRHERYVLSEQLDRMSRLNSDLRTRETKLSTELRHCQIELREGQQRLDYERQVQVGERQSTQSSGRLSPLRSRPTSDLEAKINDLNSRLNAIQGERQSVVTDQERPPTHIANEQEIRQPVLEERDMPKLLQEEQRDAFKDIKQMLADYRRDRAMVKSGKYPIVSESGAMKIMKAFSVPFARQQTAGFANHSFGVDSDLTE